ncbi:hypothetical protein F6B41_19745 [Microbacterium lushaniae]|nr:hypothetical protein F6B41_26755 [Microbacterium lushaniae]KAA9151827.1 hypothetical protein F6B41_19745 [Microbacterium lushaniae]
MSDFARYLPLSQRGQGDGPSVTADRRGALADVVDRAADLLADAGDAPPGLAASFLDVAGLRAEATGRAADGTMPLREVAQRVRAGRRRSIRALAAGVKALLLLARDLSADAGVDPFIAGAAALYASAAAPADRRAAVRGHTVRATDAPWSFGSGPPLEATSAQIAAFLLGVSDEPPRRPATGRG